MATFQYTAKNLKGEKISGVYEGDSVDALKAEMYQKGYIVTKANKEAQGIKLDNLFGKPNAKDFAIFCRQFSVILNSGLTLIEAMHILTQQTKKKMFKEILKNIHEELQKGKMFSVTLKNYRDTFPEFFINMIQVGEASGTLDDVLNRLAENYEKEHKMKKKVKAASMYPMMVVLVAVGVVTLLMVKVVPMFVKMLGEMGGETPFLTSIVVMISDFLVNNLGTIFLGVFFGGIGLGYFYKTEKGRYIFDDLKLKVPIIKNLFIKIVTAKFARSMGMLLKSGIPIIQAVDIISNLIGNRVLEEKFKVSQEDIKGGRGISTSLRKIEIFPPLLFHMITVGEKTGELDDMLMRTSVFFEEEVEEAIEQMITMIEPLLIVGLGGVVAVIILAVMLPMVSILQNIG